MFGMPRVPFVSAEQRQQGPAGARFRHAARRQHRHRVPLPQRHRVHSQRHTARRNSRHFILQFPTTYAPIVGQQTTLTSSNGGDRRHAPRPADRARQGLLRPDRHARRLRMRPGRQGHRRRRGARLAGRVAGAVRAGADAALPGRSRQRPAAHRRATARPGQRRRQPDLYLRAAGFGGAHRARSRRGRLTSTATRSTPAPTRPTR